MWGSLIKVVMVVQKIILKKPMNNKQQTAVEWFYNKIVTGKFTGKDTIAFLFETAKEMENQQTENAYEEGYNRVAKLIEDATQRNI